MLLNSSPIYKYKLDFFQLTQKMEFLPLVKEWIYNKWGYTRTEAEWGDFLTETDPLLIDLYVGLYAGLPMAIFALIPTPFCKTEEQEHIDYMYHQLAYVYVDEKYRGLGFGKQIMEVATRISKEMSYSFLDKTYQAQYVALDTATPLLNYFYIKYGAKFVCEHSLSSQSVDALMIDHSRNRLLP